MTVLRSPESGYTYGTNQDVHILDCASCGITFGITVQFEKRRRDDHERFYCPNGHSNVYRGLSELEKTQRRLQYERDRAGRLAAERDQAKAEARGNKAAKTRMKNDRDKLRATVAEGQCPVPGCGKVYKHLKRHMERQHPHYPTDQEDHEHGPSSQTTA